jgi:hypothetical protein
LPPSADLAHLPPGEVRMLQQTDALAFVRGLQQEHAVVYRGSKKSTSVHRNFLETGT